MSTARTIVDEILPRTELEELSEDDLRLLAVIAGLLRGSRGDRRSVAANAFALVWERIKARSPDMDEETAMALALEAQRRVRRTGQ